MAIYVGLGAKARYYIIVVGALVAAVNLAAAWYFAYRSADALEFGDGEIAQMERLSNNIADPLAKTITKAYLYTVYAQTKSIKNKQSLILVCFGGGFALVAVGFALFLLGADGAFSVEAQHESKSRIILTGTAPGLLCFVLAAILIAVGVTRRHELILPPFQLGGPSAAVSSTCKNILDGKCVDEALKELK